MRRIGLALSSLALLAAAGMLAAPSLSGVEWSAWRTSAKPALCVLVETVPRTEAVSAVALSPEADALRAAGVWRQYDATALPAEMVGLKAALAAKPAPAVFLVDSGGKVLASAALPADGAALRALWTSHGGKI